VTGARPGSSVRSMLAIDKTPYSIYICRVMSGKNLYPVREEGLSHRAKQRGIKHEADSTPDFFAERR
jgi:hypothetical protein